jgi:uncharacterized membrane protein
MVWICEVARSQRANYAFIQLVLFNLSYSFFYSNLIGTVNSKFTQIWGTSASKLRVLIIILLVIGVFFRFANLDHKVYWHDEAYTSLRIAGFNTQEIRQEIFQNRLITPQDLQKFQRMKPGSTMADTIESLAIEDPQHPPFYFLLARFWMQFFGGSIATSRSLPALFSLLSLPLIYALGLELFASSLAVLFATVLLALSPFDILFAQIARQYSFLTFTVISSSFLLLRAWRLPTWKNWGLYTIASTLGLYSHVLFALTLIAQVAYVFLLQLVGETSRKIAENQAGSNIKTENQELSSSSRFKIKTSKFLLSIVAALILYSPWIVVLITSYNRAVEVTGWSSVSVEIILLLKLWVLSFTCLFLDLDLGFDSIWTYLLRLPVLLIIIAAIYTVCRRTRRTTWLFILTSIFVPFLMLALPDLLVGGRRSSITRYLLSCFPGVQLAVAYFLAAKILDGKRFWRGILALLLTGSIASCTVSALSEGWWNLVPSDFNAPTAQRINAQPSPMLLSDEGNEGTNLGDLISLSYLLHNDVRLFLLSMPPDLKLLPDNTDALVFRPSEPLRKALQQKGIQLKLVFPPGQLWQLQRS